MKNDIFRMPFAVRRILSIFMVYMSCTAKNGIIRGKFNMRNVLSVIALCSISFSVIAAGRVVVPQLPPPPYDDTEISTNVEFSAGNDDVRLFALSLALDATPTNTLQLAFGHDENSDGILDWQETEFLLGWKCGEWFFRDKMSEAEAVSARESGQRSLEWNVSLDRARAPQGLAATDGCQDLGFAVSPGMFNRDWNLMRVTARGIPGPIYSAEGSVSAPGFSVRVR